MYDSQNHFYELIEELDPSIQKAFLEIGERIHLKKNDFLVKEGFQCNDIFIIEEGLFRTFQTFERNNETIEITSGFSFPGDIDTSVSSLIKNVPANENIQALIDSTILRFDFNKIKQLQMKDNNFNSLIFGALVDYTSSIEKVLFDLRVLSSRERYEKLLKEHPDYVKHIPLKYLASFLNMKVETLSRIRKP